MSLSVCVSVAFAVAHLMHAHRFYPQVEADIVELFESTTNNNLWILALAVAPDGGCVSACHVSVCERVPLPVAPDEGVSVCDSFIHKAT